MSRCFPYPPPGYLREGSGGDAANQSIKFQKEKKNTVNEQNKERKRGRDQRRNDKKENKGESYHNGDKFDQKKKRSLSHPKQLEEEAEGSGLTEEHEQPVSSQSLCYLSDGARTNKKRKLDHSDAASNGNTFRLRLTLRKPTEPDVSHGGEQQCSTSGRVESLSGRNENTICLPGQDRCYVNQPSTGSVGSELISTSKKASSRTESERKEASAEAASGTQKIEKKLGKFESMYKALVEDWVPPSIQLELNDLDDEDWLFGSAKHGVQPNRNHKACHDVSRTECSASWPRARYLPEADIYALPYTVPF